MNLPYLRSDSMRGRWARKGRLHTEKSISRSALARTAAMARGMAKLRGSATGATVSGQVAESAWLEAGKAASVPVPAAK